MIGFVAFSIVYIAFFLWARYHWHCIPDSGQYRTSRENTFSVIIPVRNESENIARLIGDLAAQQYDRDQFEVLLVDDHSEDDTVRIASETFVKTDLHYRIIRLDGVVTGKKSAITAGVTAARNEYILTTDGDCRVGTQWIAAYSDRFQVTDDLMLCGPVKMEVRGFFTRMQALEFSGLVGVGAASLQSGNPGMCNGANLAYQKTAFLRVNGYAGNEQIPSGDDEFLLQKVFGIYHGKVSYLRDQRAIVSTPAKETLAELLNQRIRWSSKWKFHKSAFIRLMAIMVFLNYAFFLYGALAVLAGWMPLALFGAIFLLRWLAVCIFSYPITQFLAVKGVLMGSVVFEIIYPFFAVILGIASIFGKYSWKGRSYR